MAHPWSLDLAACVNHLAASKFLPRKARQEAQLNEPGSLRLPRLLFQPSLQRRRRAQALTLATLLHSAPDSPLGTTGALKQPLRPRSRQPQR